MSSSSSVIKLKEEGTTSSQFYYDEVKKQEIINLSKTTISFILGSVIGALILNITRNIVHKDNVLMYTLINLIIVIMTFIIAINIYTIYAIAEQKNKIIFKTK
jgi:multisubunit Na+/H+ antiporter MnhE subunit